MPIQTVVGLHEQVKNAFEFFWRNATSVVPHTNHDVVSIPCHRQADVAPRRGVLRGIRQQIHVNLLQSRGIALHGKSCSRKLSLEALTAFFARGLHYVNRILQYLGQIHQFVTHFDLALHHARDVQQIVEQKRHLHRLALDHCQCLLE